ncbi:hypothetical protein [Marinobacter fonticola]|uniref:hypothetical protein n=1 Tax=Marinobacter fonticola TaxID=2603215 RepID=UPI0011E8423B|nr:hypothetical protein [Marinobacter fonticola]
MNNTDALARRRAGRCVTTLLAIVGSVLGSPAWSVDWRTTSPRLDEPALDQQRGGFRLGNMEIEIGLEQVVAIDGQIEIINRLLIPNLNRPLRDGPVEQHVESVEVARIVTAPSSAGTPTVTTPSQVAGAVVSASELRNGSWVTRIQNDMNERVIQNIRSLNIKLGNVGRTGRLSERFGEQFLQSPSR